MEKRQIGSSDLHASIIGLGCMSLTPEKKNENERILNHAVDLGVNYFDTADLYSFGWNEELIGNTLKPYRKDILLATKAGNRWQDGKEGWTWDPSKAYIKSAVKESLRRLQTDYIDLYQLHGGTMDDPLDETIEAFDELVQEGVVRYYGISSIRPNVINYYAKHSKIVSVMMQYSLLDRRPEELFSFLSGKNISVIARGPVAKGWLSERGLTNTTDKGYLSWDAKSIQSALNHWPQMQTGSSISQAALQYVLSSPVVATAVPGASHIAQLEENVAASQSVPLNQETIQELQSLFPPSRYEEHRVNNF